MALAQRFEDLVAWQRARELTKVVYEVTSDGAWAKDYGLRDQIRRAAISAMSNIAEGFERRGPAEFGRYLVMAKGSAGEVRSQLYVALDLGYVNAAKFDAVRILAETVSGKVAGLANYLKGRDRTSESPA